MTYVVIDLETTGLNRHNSDIVIAGVFVPELDHYWCITHRQQFYDLLNELWMRFGELRFIYTNGKFDTLFVYEKWDTMLPIDEDVMLLAYVIDMGERKSLDYLAEKHLGIKSWDIPLKEKMVYSEKNREYNEKDCRYTWALFVKLHAMLDDNTSRIYYGLALPSYRAYRKVEVNGIALDMKQLDTVINDFTAKRDQLLKQLNKLANINWNSSTQVADLLFKKLMLPVVKNTGKGVPSADAFVLTKLSHMGYKEVDLLLEYKYYDKSLGTFLEKWKTLHHNGRLFPTFNIDTTRTGRTSCSDPNLQQVPRDKALRSLFTARPGYVLMEADQSQVELRIAAEVANEQTLKQIYRDGRDAHTEMAKIITGKNEVTKDERTKAKPVNFGFLYGMSAASFVNYAEENYGVIFTEAEATEYRNRYFATYRNLKTWYKIQEAKCQEQGGVFTMFGRFRKLLDIYSSDYSEQSSAKRKAINTPVQSAASDILLCGMIEIVETVPEAIVVGTVHDSILVELPVDHADALREKIVKIMEQPRMLEMFNIHLEVPLKVDAALGNWGSK